MDLTNYCKNGVCSNCGECCSDILHLDEEEIQRIDEYMKEHKITPAPYREIDNGKETLDTGCPFRNNVMKLCTIYPVRPEICRIFKCNRSAKEAAKVRDLNNYNKLPRSMRLVFFNESRNQRLMKEYFGFKVYGREQYEVICRNTKKSN